MCVCVCFFVVVAVCLYFLPFMIFSSFCFPKDRSAGDDLELFTKPAEQLNIQVLKSWS